MDQRNKGIVMIIAVFAVLCNYPEYLAKKTTLLKSPHLQLRFTDFTHCTDVKGNAVNVTYAEFTRNFVNSFFELDRPLNTLGTVNVIITKCREKCEHFQIWRFRGSNCHLLEEKNFLWYPMLHSTRPYNMTCPVRKAHYQAVNATFDAKLVDALPLSFTEWDTWMARIEAYPVESEKNMYGCVIFGFKGFRTRAH